MSQLNQKAQNYYTEVVFQTNVSDNCDDLQIFISIVFLHY